MGGTEVPQPKSCRAPHPHPAAFGAAPDFGTTAAPSGEAPAVARSASEERDDESELRDHRQRRRDRQEQAARAATTPGDGASGAPDSYAN